MIILLISFALQVASAFPAMPTSGNQARMVYLDGNTFLNQCNESQVSCILYVQGVNDAFVTASDALDRDVPYCIPARATPVQVLMVVQAHLRAHPGDLHLMASELVITALRNTWPQCGPAGP